MDFRFWNEEEEKNLITENTEDTEKGHIMAELMRRREVLRMGVSEHVLKKAVKMGLLQRVKPIPGGHGYFKRCEVERVFEQKETKETKI